MERLLSDATKLSGIEYNIDNLDDVFMAVHAIQEEIGITGTTALEAEETIQGSFSAMKSSLTNVFGALAIGEGLDESLGALAETASTFLFDNLFPMVGTIISALPGAIVTFIQAAGPAFMESGGELISTIANGVITGIPLFLDKMAEVIGSAITWIKEQLPTILENGVEFISNFANGILNAAPGVLESIGGILSGIFEVIISALPTILKSGLELIANLAKGIWDNLPAVITSITNILSSLLKSIVEHMPQLLAKGIELVMNMAIGLVSAIPDIVAKVPLLIGAIVKGIAGLIGDFVTVGADLVKGLWRGINSVKDWILGKISGFVGSITSGIKSFFGISSPSKLMADEVGKWLPIGLAEGIEDNIRPVTKAMDELTKSMMSDFGIGNNLDVSMSSTKSGFTNKIDHGGTIRVEGVNNKNELMSVVDIVMDELRREVRA